MTCICLEMLHNSSFAEERILQNVFTDSDSENNQTSFTWLLFFYSFIIIKVTHSRWGVYMTFLWLSYQFDY